MESGHPVKASSWLRLFADMHTIIDIMSAAAYSFWSFCLLLGPRPLREEPFCKKLAQNRGDRT